MAEAPDAIIRLVTLVVSQRERFSSTDLSLASLFATLLDGVRVIFVDGASDDHSQAVLQNYRRTRPNFEIIRREHFLRQHTAFNLGYQVANARYIAFVDNDVTYSPNWLQELVATAEETNAALVGPLYLERLGNELRIHMAGGTLGMVDAPGRPRLAETHLLAHAPVDKAGNLPEVEETDLIEYHAVLVRKSFLDRVGGFDEGMLFAKNHLDPCLCAKATGERVVINRRARVVYEQPPPVTRSDRAFYRARWSSSDSVASHLHFERKWGVNEKPHPYFEMQRRVYIFSILVPLLSFVGIRNARRIYFRLIDPFIAPLERILDRRFSAALRKAGKIVDLDIKGTYALRPAYPDVQRAKIFRTT